MDLHEHRHRLHLIADAFAAELEGAHRRDQLGAPVPTCPEWTVRDLAHHLGGVLRWATWLVENRVVVETWRSELDLEYPFDGDELVRWFADSITPMISALDATRPEQPVFVWGADPHARFWTRRLHHEAAVHLIDLQVSLGRTGSLEPTAAVDAIDELLTNLPSTARWGSPIELLRGSNEALALQATDTGASWRLRFEPTGCWWDRSDAPADATLRGTASSLLLFLIGRPGDVTLSGNANVFDARRAAFAF